MADIRKQVGDRIRSLRVEKYLTQEGLAFKSGLHRSHIGEIERGECNISLKTLETVSGSLSVPPEQLFKGIETPRPKARPTRAPSPKTRHPD